MFIYTVYCTGFINIVWTSSKYKDFSVEMKLISRKSYFDIETKIKPKKFILINFVDIAQEHRYHKVIVFKYNLTVRFLSIPIYCIFSYQPVKGLKIWKWKWKMKICLKIFYISMIFLTVYTHYTVCSNFLIHFTTGLLFYKLAL